jgi:uncharacterized protein (DUF983 family)
MIGRGLRRRCPRCGGWGLFNGWWAMLEDCPTCGHHFERESGYWVGAMIVNTALTIGQFLVVFVGFLMWSWPDVPWTALTVVAAISTALLPVLAYPISKTTWVAYDLAVHPLEPNEIAAAAEHVQRSTT